MKRLMIFAFSLLIIASAKAVTISEKDVMILLNDDGTSDWTIKLVYPQPVKISDIFILAEISNVRVTVGEGEISCSVKPQSLGTSVICNNVNSNEITYEFKAYNLISKKNGINVFSYSFPMPNIVEKFILTVKLPMGAALVEKSRLEQLGLTPFKPEGGHEGSDGRRILVNWEFDKPELGKSIEVSVIYEKPGFIAQIISNIVIVALITAIIVGIGGFYLYRKRDVERVLPILDKPEREVMKIIMREKKNVNQKKIVKELGYSKAKVSRIIKSLEQRGLIKVERRGRTNIINLKRKS